MQPDVISYAVGSMQCRGVALVWRRYGRPTQSSWRDPIGEMHVLMADWLERFIPQGDKEAQLRRGNFKARMPRTSRTSPRSAFFNRIV